MNLSHPLILASNSPRRKQLLTEAGFSFQTFTHDVDESYPADLPVHQIAKYLAEKKNLYYQKLLHDKIILTADTTVILHGEILGKPTHEHEAIEMLSKLSGCKHEVVTGVCISLQGESTSFADTTEIEFRTLEYHEIVDYVSHYRPYDKAGGYGIQEKIGHIAIRKINGSYFNVVGLPIDRVYGELMKYSN